MEYYNPNNNSPKLWGGVAALLYVLLFGCAMLFMEFDITKEDDPIDGIVIQFGESETGLGEEELLATDTSAPQTTTAQVEEPEQIETDDRNDIEINKPTVDQSPKTKKEPTPKEQPIPEEKPAEPERTVNKKALFPGRQPDSESKSHGTTEGTNNQGSNSGQTEGEAIGGAEDLSGVAYSLKGRSVVGSLPKPNYGANASGRVIIDVTVDETGRVKNATYRAQGSTTNNSQLVAAARAAALKARFSTSDSFIQGGTITYTFKLD